MREVLGIGYLSRRRDGITELRINGFSQCKTILEQLVPYIRFKKVQVSALLEACTVLCTTPFSKLTKQQQKYLVDRIVIIQHENYTTKSKKRREELYACLDLTP